MEKKNPENKIFTEQTRHGLFNDHMAFCHIIPPICICAYECVCVCVATHNHGCYCYRKSLTDAIYNGEKLCTSPPPKKYKINKHVALTISICFFFSTIYHCSAISFFSQSVVHPYSLFRAYFCFAHEC